MLRTIVLFLVAMSLAACASVGSYVDEDSAENVIDAVKTAKELSDTLGVPSVTIPMGDGTTMWVYEGAYRTSNVASYVPYVGLVAGRTNKKCTRLTALVDNETGVVTEVKYETVKDSDFWAKYEEKCKAGSNN